MAGPQIPYDVKYAGGPTMDHVVGKNTSPDVNAYLADKAPDLGVRVPDLSDTVASRFPQKLTHADPRDEIMALKAQKLNENAAAGGEYGGAVLKGVGVAQATDEDFRYFRDKELAERQGDFKRYFLENIDLSNPVNQDYYQRMYPQIFEERESLAEKQIEHQAHLMKINLRGPRNMEDWMFLYGIDRGFIQIPKGPIWDPENLLATDFASGLFSVRHILPRDGNATKLPGSVTKEFGGGKNDGFKFNWKKPFDFSQAVPFAPPGRYNQEYQKAPGRLTR